jgi:MFS family permease
METLSIPKPQISATQESSIQWKQLWSLASLYASIVIGWIAYHRYQPKLLVQFKFTDFTFLLILAQSIILVFTPLIAGKLGDRYRFTQGHRLPIISSGISFAAMIFMAVAFTLFSSPGEIFKWILPVLIVFWLIAMSIFISPALSTMELFTPADKLPKVMAVLTIVANLIYSLEPVIVDIIDFVGAPVTFMLGGVVVFISGYALKKNSLGLFHQTDDKEPKITAFKLDTQKSQYGFIFLLGIILGVATTVMFNLFPDILQVKIGSLINVKDGNLILVGILVLSAILSLPLSSIMNKYGLKKIFWISTALIFTSMAVILFVDVSVVVVVMTLIFSIAFTSLSVSSLPLAINNSNYYEKVFCVGIFFSGVALPDGILESIIAF